jgi:hypothetical protein
MPLTGLVITTFAGAAVPTSGPWWLVWSVVFAWTAACWIIAASRSARPRLGDMAGVIAAFLVLVPAGAWAAICVSWGRVLADLVHAL